MDNACRPCRRFSAKPDLSIVEPAEPMLQPRPTPCARVAGLASQPFTRPARYIGAWRGIYQTRAGNGAKIEPAMLQAAVTPVADTNQVLRAARSRVWRIAAPWQPETGIIIKQFKVPDPALGCTQTAKAPQLNGAQELLRRD